MIIENEIRLTECNQEPEVVEVEPYVVDALKAVTLPQQKQGGCTIMPKTYLVSAEDKGFRWDMNFVNEIAKSSQEFGWGTEDDLAQVFGRILLNLRAGRSTTVGMKQYPVIRAINYAQSNK